MVNAPAHVNASDVSSHGSAAHDTAGADESVPFEPLDGVVDEVNDVSVADESRVHV